MKKQNWLVLISLTGLLTIFFKLADNFLDSNRFATVASQICQSAQPRLQVGTTREVVDTAHAALISFGFPEAEITLKEGSSVFVESSTMGNVFHCPIKGRENVEFSLTFPKAGIWGKDTPFAFLVIFVFLIAAKLFLSFVVKGLQAKFINEMDRRLSSVLSLTSTENVRTTWWIDWLYETDLNSVIQFKYKLKELEERVKRQTEDIKERSREKAIQESKLFQARKFKDMAHQIRHDLRQTLGVLKSSVETLPTNLPEAKILNGSIWSLEHMVEDLREREIEHSAPNELQIELLEIAVNDVAAEQRSYLGKTSGIKVSCNLTSSKLSCINVKPDELKRVITNLVRNSIEAIDGVGEIDISVSQTSDGIAILSIHDTGTGFSAESLNNLFKKGFTTKKNGSGRGLSYCQEKIKEWGGLIHVESAKGNTVLTIELPVFDFNVDFACPSILKDEKKVLVVDDLPDTRKIGKLVSGSVSYAHSWDEYKEFILNTKDCSDHLAVFDLHLGRDTRSLDFISEVPAEQSYLFMTSDYFNIDLIASARERGFTIIPKELL